MFFLDKAPKETLKITIISLRFSKKKRITMPLFLFFPSFPFYREISKKGRTYPVVMQNALCIPARRHIMRFSDTKRSAEKFAKYDIHLIEVRPFSRKNIVCRTCCLVWRSTREVIV